MANLKVGYKEVKNRSKWPIMDYLTDRELCNEGKEYLEIVERLLSPVLAMVQLASVCKGYTEEV